MRFSEEVFMGKKNVPKSPSKKKTTSKKKKDETLKQPTASKKGSKSKTVAKEEGMTKASEEFNETALKSRQKPSLRDLIFKKFDVHKPDLVYAVRKTGGIRDYTSPPYYTAKDDQDAERIRNLLFKAFDFSAISTIRVSEGSKSDTPENTSLSKKPPAAPPDYRTLIMKRFERRIPPLFVVKPNKAGIDYTAPPFFRTDSQDEADRLKGLLLKRVDLKSRPVPEGPAETMVSIQAAETGPAAAPPDYRTLIMKKFDRPTPVLISVVMKGPEKDFTAPPFFTAETDEEAHRKKGLLFKKFDLHAVSEEAPKRKPAEIAEIPAETMPGPVRKELPPQPKVEVAYEKPPKIDMEERDPMDKFVKYAIAGFALIVLLIVAYSFANTSNYYIRPTKAGIDIWQGKFSPLGEELLISLPGIKAPTESKAVYSKKDVYPLVFAHYLDKADSLLEEKRFPEFEQIEENASKALKYSISKEERDAAHARITSLQSLVFQYRANVAISRGDLKSAKELLGQAKILASDEFQKEAIQQRINSLSQAPANPSEIAGGTPAASSH
jgi:hypothetical protein